MSGNPLGSASFVTRRAPILLLVLVLAVLALGAPIAGAQSGDDRTWDSREVQEGDQERDRQRLNCREPRTRLEEKQCRERAADSQERTATEQERERQEADKQDVGIQQAPVLLGTAGSFAVLAGSTVTNTGPTVVSGNLGVSPGSAVVGFPPGTVVNGTIHAGNAVAAQAQSDLTVAYNDAAGRPCDVDLTGQDLGGLVLTSGVYCFSTSAQLTGTLTLDAQGDPDAVFIFQIGTTLTTASASSVNLINGASPCNVFWQVGSSATLGTTTSFVGTVMANQSITANTGATVEGRLLARVGAVTLDDNIISLPDCAPPPPPGEASITIVKETEPDAAENFEFTGDLGTFILDDDLTSDTPRQRTFTVTPGTVTVTESPEAAFDLESITCTGGTTTVSLSQRSVVIDTEDGDTVRCVFVNEAEVVPPPPPGEASITIVKEVEPDDPQNFAFSGDLGSFVLDDDLFSATPRQRIFTVAPGVYTVTEAAVAGFDLDSITCSGGATAVDLGARGVRIEVEEGDTVTCVFVNEPEALPPPPPGEAAITIVKEVEPDDPQNFEFTGDLGTFLLDDDLTSATPRERIFTVEPGTFTVIESAAPGFDLDSITCTGGQTAVNLEGRRVVIRVAEGDTVTCVFVNEPTVFPPPPPPGDALITIVKETEPDSPQNFQFTGDLGEFILDDDLLSATPRERIFVVDPGDYTVIESLVAGFDLDSITCSGGLTTVNLGGRGVRIEVEEGDAVTCVFVNVAVVIPPPPPGDASIRIVKDAEPDGPQNFEFTGGLGNFILDDDLLSATPRQRIFTVDPGTFTVIESVAPGFDLDSIVCTGGQTVVSLEGRRVVIRVAEGDTVTCVFVNTARVIPPPPPGQGSIRIVKNTIPDGPRNFEFTGDLGTFILDDDPLSATPRQRRFDLDPGTYTIRESDVGAFLLQRIHCTGGETIVDLAQRRVTIRVRAGDVVTCAFVNVARAAGPGDGDGGPGDGPGVGLPVTGLGVGGLLLLSFLLMSSGQGLRHAGRRRPGRYRGRHRPGAAPAFAAATTPTRTIWSD